MIKLESTDVYGFEQAIHGMRNPMNSWGKSDSSWWCECSENVFKVGENDLNLMNRLYHAGTDHGKFMRQIQVWVTITAPLYWWKEFDTYKVGTTSNSCSTMHKIHEKEFTLDDFSHDQIDEEPLKIRIPNLDGLEYADVTTTMNELARDVAILNANREKFIETGNKKYWWAMVQKLPSSYNQTRTINLNYQVIANAYKSRKGHKLDEWQTFREWAESLPYFTDIVGEGK